MKIIKTSGAYLIQFISGFALLRTLHLFQPNWVIIIVGSFMLGAVNTLVIGFIFLFLFKDFRKANMDDIILELLYAGALIGIFYSLLFANKG